MAPAAGFRAAPLAVLEPLNLAKSRARQLLRGTEMYGTGTCLCNGRSCVTICKAKSRRLGGPVGGLFCLSWWLLQDERLEAPLRREGGCISNRNHTSTLDKQQVAPLQPANRINLNAHRRSWVKSKHRTQAKLHHLAVQPQAWDCVT